VAEIRVNNIFCVLDPTTNRQAALNRATWIATAYQARIHAYLCHQLPSGIPAADRTEFLAAERARYEAWADRLVEPARAQGITVTVELESADDWRDALVVAAARSNADLIVRTTQRRTALQRRVLKTTDWTLLREARCPVLLIKSDARAPLEHVLAAVNLNARDAAHRELTDIVIDYAKAVATATGAELHAANAYQDEVNFVHPPDLAKRLDIERRQTHVANTTPDKLIAETVAALGDPLVVIGSLARKGMTGAIVGNTAERILDQLQTDVLCIVKPG
jgi:universal stress protein E